MGLFYFGVFPVVAVIDAVFAHFSRHATIPQIAKAN